MKQKHRKRTETGKSLYYRDTHSQQLINKYHSTRIDAKLLEKVIKTSPPKFILL